MSQWGTLLPNEPSPRNELNDAHRNCQQAGAPRGDLATGGSVAVAAIGRIGTSGNTTGAHLHLEVRVEDRPTDPATYLWGAEPGMPGPVPRWYPAVPIMTVAQLAPLGSR